MLRFLSCTGTIETVLGGTIKAPGAKQVPARSTMRTEQRACVKVLSRGQIIDEQERRRDKETCRMQRHDPAQEAGN